MSDIGPVKTINAIRSKYSSLGFEDLLIATSFLDKKAELGLNISNFIHEVINLVKLIAMCLSMEVVPDMFDIPLGHHLKKGHQADS